MKKNVIKEKSYAFAIRVVRMYQTIVERIKNTYCRSNVFGAGLPSELWWQKVSTHNPRPISSAKTA